MNWWPGRHTKLGLAVVGLEKLIIKRYQLTTSTMVTPWLEDITNAANVEA